MAGAELGAGWVGSGSDIAGSRSDCFYAESQTLGTKVNAIVSFALAHRAQTGSAFRDTGISQKSPKSAVPCPASR